MRSIVAGVRLSLLSCAFLTLSFAFGVLVILFRHQGKALHAAQIQLMAAELQIKLIQQEAILRTRKNALARSIDAYKKEQQ